MTKPTKWHVRPAKTQISESSLCAQWVGKDPRCRHADSEDSDQTGWMPRLLRVFAWRTCHLVGFDMRRLISFYASLFVFVGMCVFCFVFACVLTGLNMISHIFALKPVTNKIH